MGTIWKFLNGKKTTIAAFLNLTALWIFQKEWIEETDLIYIAGALTAWTGGAALHKIMKVKK